MKILQVVHGYPPRYNAGSEVYTQTLSRHLAKEHEVRVFSRIEDVSVPAYAIVEEVDTCPSTGAVVPLEFVNMAGFRERFWHERVDDLFSRRIDSFRPDVIHIQHLNHLSLGILERAYARGIPVVYTLHDFWLSCPRGQFLQACSEIGKEPLALCDGQEDKKCAQRCYQRSSTGLPDEKGPDLGDAERWVRARREKIKELSQNVFKFIAPSRHLMDRMKSALELHNSKISLLDYGFDQNRLGKRKRNSENSGEFVFGYIGTHVPAKGVGDLIEAFGKIGCNAKLRIFGRRNLDTDQMIESQLSLLSPGSKARVEMVGEYRNEDISAQVFNLVDAIVVPSKWLENAPLVIHEAIQARVPVITADLGGMAEFVRHEENGLLFKHRNVASLATQMARMVDDPDWAARLGRRGHWYRMDGNVTSIEEHVQSLEEIYEQAKRSNLETKAIAGPWRITFDTNPDDCNLKCAMCEEHSPFSERQTARKACGQPARRMDIEVFHQTMSSLNGNAPAEIIPSTMGEPLLYPDFDQILVTCRRKGSRLNLTTNGTFPWRGPRRWGQVILPLASDVKISMNAMTDSLQEAIMSGKSASILRDNVEEFVAVRDEIAKNGGHRASITLQVTFMERNLLELPAIVEFAQRIGIDRVKGHHLWVHFGEMRQDDLRRSSDSRARWNATAKACRNLVDEYKTSHIHALHLENFDLLSEEDSAERVPEDYECPFLGKEAWINHAGRFDPCCAPDDQRKTLGSFGFVTEDGGLEAIWNSDAYLDLVKNYRSRELCKSCLMRRPVTKGDCI